MFEPMTVWVKVFAVAADKTGLWLSGNDGWLDGPVMADSSEHFMVQSLLREHGIDPADVKDGGDCLMLHFTSWHPDGPRHVDTCVVAVRCDGLALDMWPDARPITPDLYDDPDIGPPPTHGATEEPMPRELDTLIHGLGHYKWQIKNNAEHRRALGRLWRVQLEPFRETLAGMYQREHRAA